MNIVPFSKFDDDRQVAAHQLGLPRVILEGPDDVELFQEWFADLNVELEFVKAEDVGKGGGCTAVGDAVATSREIDGIPAVGVVDRDTLHREHRWSVVFSTDEEAFSQLARTEAVYTTSLWEVEAYLLVPDLLAEWVAAQRKNLPAPRAERVSALAKTLEECEGLLAAAAFYGACHASGAGAPDGHFLEKRHHELPAACEAKIALLADDHREVALEIDALIAEIRAQAPEDAAERLIYLLRYVDTKRLLTRLRSRLKLRDDAHWGLASLMSGKDLRPAELEGFLVATAERYAA